MFKNLDFNEVELLRKRRFYLSAVISKNLLTVDYLLH